MCTFECQSKRSFLNEEDARIIETFTAKKFKKLFYMHVWFSDVLRISGFHKRVPLFLWPLMLSRKGGQTMFSYFFLRLKLAQFFLAPLNKPHGVIIKIFCSNRKRFEQTSCCMVRSTSSRNVILCPLLFLSKMYFISLGMVSVSVSDSNANPFLIWMKRKSTWSNIVICLQKEINLWWCHIKNTTSKPLGIVKGGNEWVRTTLPLLRFRPLLENSTKPLKKFFIHIRMEITCKYILWLYTTPQQIKFFGPLHFLDLVTPLVPARVCSQKAAYLRRKNFLIRRDIGSNVSVDV